MTLAQKDITMEFVTARLNLTMAALSYADRAGGPHEADLEQHLRKQSVAYYLAFHKACRAGAHIHKGIITGWTKDGGSTLVGLG